MADVRVVRNLQTGAVARGATVGAIFLTRVVRTIAEHASRFSAIGPIRAISRSINVDFVISPYARWRSVNTPGTSGGMR